MSSMSALKKEEIFKEFDNLIKTLSEEEQLKYADKVIRIKEKVEQYLVEDEDSLYNGILYDSLKEDWENKKDDAYNDL